MMRSNIKFLFYFLATTGVLVYWSSRSGLDFDVPIVNAPVGDISGTPMRARKGRDIYAYKGIPYVHPPVGDLRFKRPKPFAEGTKAWQGIFDGSKVATKCVQKTGLDFYPTFGQEDCLQLNVYVPKLEEIPKDGLPVMFWVHGGGFLIGDGTETVYGPSVLLNKDVILVTINYRLGILGFLNLGNDEISGNQGLWDQYEALRWVSRNIQAFGGDPKKVTIFGESAGGWSISYLLASRKTNGLFRSAISQSGGLDQPFLNHDDHHAVPDIHNQFVEKVKCYQTNTLECLQSKTIDEILVEQNMFDECNVVSKLAFPIIWTPSDDSKTRDPFFAKHPKKVYESGDFVQVPTMLGSTKDEGLLISSMLRRNPEFLDTINDHWNRCMAPHALGKFFLDGKLSKQDDEKIKEITDFYFNGVRSQIKFDHWTFDNLTNMFTDNGFFYSGAKMAEQVSKKSLTYYYQFDHVGYFSFHDMYGKNLLNMLWTLFLASQGLYPSEPLGAAHGDELLYLFGKERNVKNERDSAMCDFMTELWTNFVIHQKPTLDGSWPAYGVQGTTYVRLDNAQINLNHDLHRDQRLKFWQNMLK